MPIPADDSLQAVDEVAAGVDTLSGSSTDQNLAAARQFERAREVLSGGNHEYARHLLLSCCNLDPANLHYRRALRKTSQAVVRRGALSRWMGSLAVLAVKAKLQMAKRAGDHQKVLLHGEEVLARSPDEVGVQLEMAAAAEALQLLPLAVWLAEQARDRHPKNVTVLRALAELYERQKKFSRAFALWELVKKEAPLDRDAQGKMNELAAKETIERGGYKGRLSRRSPGRRDSVEET
jgi:tetratricopeptide (TPR) repeat protein